MFKKGHDTRIYRRRTFNERYNKNRTAQNSNRGVCVKFRIWTSIAKFKETNIHPRTSFRKISSTNNEATP